MLDGFRFRKSRTLPVLAKVGELKRDMDKAKGAQGQLSGRDSSGGFTIRPPEEQPKTLSDLGIGKAWTPSEKVAIARALEEEMAGRVGSNQYKKKEPSNNCYEAKPGQRSDEIAAEKAGFGSHMTYRRAKRVVDKGVPELVGAMDAGGRPAGQALLLGLASSVGFASSRNASQTNVLSSLRARSHWPNASHG